MRIGLSCTAEGFGLAARLVSTAGELAARHEVFAFIHERMRSFVSENLPGVESREIPYYSFVIENDQVRYGKTLARNLALVLERGRVVDRLADEISLLGLDGVVCDFDPFLAAAARKIGLPAVQLNHPSVVLRNRSLKPDALLAKAGARFLERPYDVKIVSSFYDGDAGPMIRKGVRNLRSSRSGPFLVYLNGGQKAVVRDNLERFGIRDAEYFPDESKDFLSVFARCRGVVCTAGHQMIAEAVCLGKPLLLIPQRSQFEQELNARMLEASGWGLSTTLADFERTLTRFLDGLDRFGLRPVRRDVRFDFSDSTGRVVSFIEEFLDSFRAASPNRAEASAKSLSLVQHFPFLGRDLGIPGRLRGHVVPEAVLIQDGAEGKGLDLLREDEPFREVDAQLGLKKV